MKKKIASFIVCFGVLFNPLLADNQDVEIIDSPENGFFGWELYKEEDVNTKFLLITGCVGSGIYYTKALIAKAGGLKELGLKRGRDWVVSWNMAVDCKNIRKCPLKDIAYEHIFHQVRNPLNVIAALYKNFPDTNGRFWQFTRKHVPEISEDDSLLVQCAKCWYHWNLICEKRAEFRYRIEDIEEAFPDFKKRLGITIDQQAFEELPKTFYTWKPVTEPFTWQELQQELPRVLYNNVQKMAKKYGYPTRD